MNGYIEAGYSVCLATLTVYATTLVRRERSFRRRLPGRPGPGYPGRSDSGLGDSGPGDSGPGDSGPGSAAERASDGADAGRGGF